VIGGVRLSPPFRGGNATRTVGSPPTAARAPCPAVCAERPGKATSARAEKTAANATDAASASRVIRPTVRMPFSRSRARRRDDPVSEGRVCTRVMRPRLHDRR
jgi:hypothetical protein